MSNPFQNTEQVNAVIRIRRGYDNERLSNTFDEGELIYSVDKKRLFVGDGRSATSTNGGVLVGNKIWITDNLLSLSQIQKYDLVYRTDSGYTGFYLLTGDNYQEDSNYVLFGGPQFLAQLGNFTLTPATRNVLGGVKVKSGLDIDDDGSVSAALNTDTLELDSNNKIKVKNPYTGINRATNSEFGGLVLGNGLTYNNTTNKVDVNYSNFGTSLLSSTGYQKFPSGLIMQWGITSLLSGDGSITANLPIPFVAQGFNIQATVSGVSAISGATNSVKASFINLSSIVISNDEYTTSTSISSNIYWQAVGV
jgi:hypothetical protein